MRIVAALVVAALLLVGVELVRTHEPPRIANPCVPRTLPDVHGLDATVQRIVLAGLDRTACRLRTSREALVLSIAGSSAGGGPRWTKVTVATAVRAGLRGSLDDAARRGDVPGFAVPLMRGVIDKAPIHQLVSGAFSLRSLFG
jgi:hypothetical protein